VKARGLHTRKSQDRATPGSRPFRPRWTPVLATEGPRNKARPRAPGLTAMPAPEFVPSFQTPCNTAGCFSSRIDRELNRRKQLGTRFTLVPSAAGEHWNPGPVSLTREARVIIRVTGCFTHEEAPNAGDKSGPEPPLILSNPLSIRPGRPRLNQSVTCDHNDLGRPEGKARRYRVRLWFSPSFCLPAFLPSARRRITYQRISRHPGR